MPITLVTGLPGHGKTLYTLARWKPEAEKAGRPVFHNDIPGLNIPGWQPWKVEKWQELPAGSIMVVDEAQFAFPVTGRGQTPEWVQKLATHRHLGIDLVVITQSPMLLDSFVRRLVDRHFHVIRKFGTSFATVYEFVNGVKEDVAKSRGDGIRHEFRYPKEVFTWYKSAELHTVKARIPMRVWLLGVLPVMFFALCWLAYKRMNPEARQAEMNAAVGIANPKGTQGTIGPTSGLASDGRASAKMTAAEYTAAYTPRLEGLPHTAPIYDGVTQPQQAPYPAACIASAKRCQCYSQQSTKLDMPEVLCRKLADGGFFVAWAMNGDRVQAPLSARKDEPGDYTPQAAPSLAGSLGSARQPQHVAQAEEPPQPQQQRVRRPIQ